MRSISWILVSVCLTSSLGADEPKGVTEEGLQAYVDKRSKEIAIMEYRFEREITAIKLAHIDTNLAVGAKMELVDNQPRYTFKSEEVKQKSVSNLEAKRANLEDVNLLLPEMPHNHKMEVGQIGRLVARETRTNDGCTHHYNVYKILDEQNALINWRRSSSGPYNPISDYRGLFSYPPKHFNPEDLVWIVGSTQGLTDAKLVDIAGTYKVTSTKTYNSQVGSKTVFVLEKFDASEYLPKAKPIDGK